MTIDLSIEGNSVRVDIVARSPLLKVCVTNETGSIEATASGHDYGKAEMLFMVGSECLSGHALARPDGIWLRVNGRTYFVPRQDARGTAGRGTERDDVRADMPGTVVSLQVAPGSTVKEGDPLLTIESMKLQIALTADRDGEIAEVRVAPNGTFERGAVLLVWRAATTEIKI